MLPAESFICLVARETTQTQENVQNAKTSRQTSDKKRLTRVQINSVLWSAQLVTSQQNNFVL